MPLKILTFNHHEPYLHLLSKTSHEFHVVERKGSLDLSWNKQKRPVPQNVTLIAWDEVLRKKIESGFYDVIVAHTVKNLLWLFPFFRTPIVFVIHISLQEYSLLQRINSFVKRYFLIFFKLTHRCKVVSISKLRRDSWRIDAHIIKHCLDSHMMSNNLTSVSSHKYDLLYVCNNLLERKDELGYGIINEIHKKIPVQIIGYNPGLPFSITPKNHDEFIRLFSQGRIYIYSIQLPNDGYNLAMLEAMILGMPVVTIANPSSPIVHGFNGLVGHDTEEMVNHINYLLNNPKELKRMGHAAKKTVIDQFSEERFISQWNKVLEFDSYTQT